MPKWPLKRAHHGDFTLLAQLLDLNLAVARRIDRAEQVTAPGLPPNFPDPSRLITDDCIRP